MISSIFLFENSGRRESTILEKTDAKSLEKSRIMIDKTPEWKNPNGDGHAGRRMVNVSVETGLGK